MPALDFSLVKITVGSYERAGIILNRTVLFSPKAIIKESPTKTNDT